MFYDPIEPVSRESAVRVANSNEPDSISRVIIAVALHGDERCWAEAFCEQFASHPNASVRGSALLGFGHLARRFRELDTQRIKPLLELGLSDPDKWVRAQTESAVDDAEFFLGWRFQRPQ